MDGHRFVGICWFFQGKEVAVFLQTFLKICSLSFVLLSSRRLLLPYFFGTSVCNVSHGSFVESLIWFFITAVVCL